MPGASVHVVDGIIQKVGRFKAPKGAEKINGRGQYLLPGFVDIHVHGGMNEDTMEADATGFQKMAKFFAKSGVTSFLPTTVTATAAEINKTLATLRPLVGKYINGARILGVHLEGPYLNAEYCGAQESDLIRPASEKEYQVWLNSGIVKLVTAAPEIKANKKFIAACKSKKIAVAVGHSAASYDEAIQSFKTGVTQATHMFNRMRGDLARDPGVKVAVLNTDNIIAQIICDGVHVHRANVLNLYKRKGIDGIAIITDAVRAMGQKDGAYKLGHQTIYKKGSSATLKNGALAGAVVSFDQMFRNMIQMTGCQMWEASRMASLTPATSIGLGKKIGLIEKNYIADFILMDKKLRVVATWVAGEKI